jgi:hypothetical protein
VIIASVLRVEGALPAPTSSPASTAATGVPGGPGRPDALGGLLARDCLPGQLFPGKHRQALGGADGSTLLATRRLIEGNGTIVPLSTGFGSPPALDHGSRAADRAKCYRSDFSASELC